MTTSTQVCNCCDFLCNILLTNVNELINNKCSECITFHLNISYHSIRSNRSESETRTRNFNLSIRHEGLFKTRVPRPESGSCADCSVRVNAF